MTTKVLLPYLYVASPTSARPVFNGAIYLGEADMDPELNPVQAYVLQENGTTVPIAQPILTGAGGVPLYNGSAAIITVDDNYSMRIRDELGAQIYYVANGLAGETGALNDTYVPRAGTGAGPDMSGPIIWANQVNGKRYYIGDETIFNEALTISKLQDTDPGSIMVAPWDGSTTAYITTFREDGQVVLPQNVDYTTISERSAVPKKYIDDAEAFGVVDSDGTKLGGTPNWSAVRVSVGVYTITFDVAAIGQFDQVIIGQLSGLGAGQFLNAACSDTVTGNVVLFAADGTTPVDEAFQFRRSCVISSTIEP